MFVGKRPPQRPNIIKSKTKLKRKNRNKNAKETGARTEINKFNILFVDVWLSYQFAGVFALALCVNWLKKMLFFSPSPFFFFALFYRRKWNPVSEISSSFWIPFIILLVSSPRIFLLGFNFEIEKLNLWFKMCLKRVLPQNKRMKLKQICLPKRLLANFLNII